MRRASFNFTASAACAGCVPYCLFHRALGLAAFAVLMALGFLWEAHNARRRVW